MVSLRFDIVAIASHPKIINKLFYFYIFQHFSLFTVLNLLKKNNYFYGMYLGGVTLDRQRYPGLIMDTVGGKVSISHNYSSLHCTIFYWFVRLPSSFSPNSSFLVNHPKTQTGYFTNLQSIYLF